MSAREAPGAPPAANGPGTPATTGGWPPGAPSPEVTTPGGPPPEVTTLGGLLDHAARAHPGRQARTFFSGESTGYRDLVPAGHRAARGLLALGVRPGDPVALHLRSVVPLLRAIHAVTRAGAAAMPLPVPYGRPTTAHLARLRHVLADSGTVHVVVDDPDSARALADLPGLRPVTVSELVAAGDGDGALPDVGADDLAVLQYTSGSVSEPRGVALSHRNVVAGIRALLRATGVGPADVVGHWLPLSHDMGLFSSLTAVAGGAELRVSPPWDFVKHPDLWLARACELGVTVTVGPNFAYQLMVDSVPAEEVPDLDLSRLRLALNGAEQVRPELLRDFRRHFAPAALPPGAMTPCYGMAEATLGISFAPLDEPARVDWVDRAALNGALAARPAAAWASGSRGVVDCGRAAPGVELRVTRAGRPLDDREVGHLEIRGEAVMCGYHRHRGDAVGPDGWFDTGDLGYLVAGSVHVTGRSKEMIVVGGQNYYPQDVEETVRDVPGLHARRAVAVVLADGDGGGRLCVLGEVDDPAADPAPLVAAVGRAAAELVGGATVDVVLLRRNGLLRTTSGKFQRVLMRRQLEEGTLARVLAHVPAVGA